MNRKPTARPTVTFEEIRSALPKLSVKQRAELLQRLKTLPGGDMKPLEGDSDDWLLAGLGHELNRRGLLANPSALRRMNSFVVYQKKALSVRAHLERHFDVDVQASRTQLYALGRIVAKAYVDYMRFLKGLPPGALLANIDKVPQAVEAAFPGYMQMGSLKFLVGAGMEAV